jgi:hypothetical protein
MLEELGGSTVIGPLLVGLDKPIQIVRLAGWAPAACDTRDRQFVHGAPGHFGWA